MVKQFHQHSSSLQITIFIGGKKAGLVAGYHSPMGDSSSSSRQRRNGDLKAVQWRSRGGPRGGAPRAAGFRGNGGRTSGRRGGHGEDVWFYSHELWNWRFGTWMDHDFPYIYIYVYIYMYIGKFIIPSDELIFFRGVETTKQWNYWVLMWRKKDD